MKKLLIIITCFASLWLTACSSPGFHLIHKIDVQQGNVISQDEVNQLKPGMSRKQVQFVLGSPMIADVFHQQRWDYVFLFQPGYGAPTKQRMTLTFEDNKLTHITGTIQPDADGDAAPPRPKQVTLVVPPEERIPPGVLNRLWHWLTFRKIDEETI